MYEGVLLVFFRNILAVGGLESIIYNISKDVSANGGKVMIVMGKDKFVDDAYKDLLSDTKIKICTWKNFYKILLTTIKDGNVNNVKIISFSAYLYSLSELVKKTICKYSKIDTFFLIPHFKGESIYLEEPYKGKKRKKLIEKYKRILNKMVKGQNLRCCSVNHIEELKKRYDLILYYKGKESELCPEPRFENNQFDEDNSRILWNRERFNILSVGRFDFPHKAFLIGLVKAYSTIKIEHPNVCLTICGYGPSEDILMSELSLLSEEARKDVTLIGKQSPESLIPLYKDANLNISVAGCYSLGLKYGILSIPARHYNYTCEVYGLSPEANSYAVSSIEGMPVIDYIEQVISMEEQEYIDRCKKTFESYAKCYDNEDRYLLNYHNSCNKSSLSICDIFFICFEHIKESFRYRCKFLYQ